MAEYFIIDKDGNVFKTTTYQKDFMEIIWALPCIRRRRPLLQDMKSSNGHNTFATHNL